MNVNGGHQGGHVHVLCGDHSKMHVTTDRTGEMIGDVTEVANYNMRYSGGTIFFASQRLNYKKSRRQLRPMTFGSKFCETDFSFKGPLLFF